MAPIIMRLTSKGQFTLPRRLRDALGVRPGDYVALTPTPEGILLTAAEVSASQRGEAALLELVREIGQSLEARGITEEDQLNGAIEQARQR